MGRWVVGRTACRHAMPRRLLWCMCVCCCAAVGCGFVCVVVCGRHGGCGTARTLCQHLSPAGACGTGRSDSDRRSVCGRLSRCVALRVARCTVTVAVTVAPTSAGQAGQRGERVGGLLLGRLSEKRRRTRGRGAHVWGHHNTGVQMAPCRGAPSHHTAPW